MKRALLCGVMLLGTAAFTASAQEMEKPRYHHTRINAVDPAASIQWYKTMFSAVPVKYRGVSDAVLVDRSFILFNKVDEPAPWKLVSGIYHIGWGGIDGPSEFEWRNKKGVEWETPLSTLGNNYFMYAYGPDKEVVEVWTGCEHERFGHVHLFSDDVGAATEWYVKNLNLTGPARMAPKPPAAPKDFKANPDNPMEIFRYLWSSQVTTENDVTINLFATPSADTVNWWSYDPIDELVASDGRSINHLAFSYRDIEPVCERMKANGVEIVKPIEESKEFGFKSCFVRGPDEVLSEIVEGKPSGEGVWWSLLE